MQSALIITALVLLILIPSVLIAQNLSPVTLAKTFNGEMKAPAYWVSEKLDGIRCYWNGEQLYTRNGNVIHAPKWFIEQLPKESLDGELWAGRGGYQAVTRTVLDKTPNHEQWRKIQYKVFDLPQSQDPFEQRQAQLVTILNKINVDYISRVKQTKLHSIAEINERLARVVDQGGEGLMLRPSASKYVAGRSNTLLKVKPRQDSEARVIAYQAGRGKYENMMGAVWVELANGKMFKIGSGFNEQERKNPPPIGSDITFTHEGFTEKGLPRFATYKRVREKE